MNLNLMLFTAIACILGLLAPSAIAQDEAAPSTENKEESAMQYVLMQTSMGDIALELNREKAPITVENFMNYVEKGHYDGTIFHRVISNFMIQGGGFTPDLEQKPTDAPIKNEWRNGLKNERGTIAMARLGGRPDSATAQFFINVQDNTFLDQPRDGAGYAVFGRVVKGMDVVDKIRSVPTGDRDVPGGARMGDVPEQPVTITRVRELTHAEVEEMKAQQESR